MPQGADDEGENGVSGVLRLSQAELFENDDEANAARPFLRAAPRSPGRPKGSPNKRTVAMRDVYLRKGYTHPLLFLGEIVSMKTADLALELQCELLDALEVQRKAAADALPYIESKMPTEQLIKGEDGLPMLVIGKVEAGQIGASDDGAMSIDAVEENQALSAPARATSDDKASDDKAKG